MSIRPAIVPLLSIALLATPARALAQNAPAPATMPVPAGAAPSSPAVMNIPPHLLFQKKGPLDPEDPTLNQTQKAELRAQMLQEAAATGALRVPRRPNVPVFVLDTARKAAAEAQGPAYWRLLNAWRTPPVAARPMPAAASAAPTAAPSAPTPTPTP